MLNYLFSVYYLYIYILFCLSIYVFMCLYLCVCISLFFSPSASFQALLFHKERNTMCVIVFGMILYCDELRHQFVYIKYKTISPKLRDFFVNLNSNELSKRITDETSALKFWFFLFSIINLV